MLNSPLAAATRARVYHQRHRSRPPERGLRVLAMIGSLLVHLLFLFAFVLGPAYQLAPPPPSKEQFLQVRLIEPPPPPPPPPVRGTPPKELGPRHQGRRSPAVSSGERNANAQAAAAPAPVAAKPVIATAARPRTVVPKPLAAAPAPTSLPKPAPAPEVPLLPPAGEPPVVALPTPTLQPPAPPKFQPEPVRAPQLEGNEPMPPPASLTLTRLPPQAPSISVPNIALQIEAPKTAAPVSVVPNQAPPAAPPVPRQRPVPLPAEPSPRVNLQNAAIEPTPIVPRELPHVQLPAITLAPTELPPVPLTAAPPAPQPPAPAPAPAEKIETLDRSSVPAIQPSIQPSVLRPSVAAPTTVASALAPAPAPASQPAQSPSAAPAPAEPPATRETTPSPGDVQAAPDLSSAPDATPLGSDYATPGEPAGVAGAQPSPAASVAAATPSPAGQGAANGQRGKLPGAASQIGQAGENQPGAAQGEKQGELGGYVQLKPHGDTKIMSHGVPNIGYRPTRFEQDWTPEGESSIDTALRRAVEKTTVKHTFHLPRGIRVQCAVMPLLPMSLLGCRNPDPPPRPVAEKVYERLHLAPANPLVPPAPAPAASTAPAPMVKFDNAAECAAARVAGGPPPPGCERIVLPVRPGSPASSSSSWVPASDQFH